MYAPETRYWLPMSPWNFRDRTAQAPGATPFDENTRSGRRTDLHTAHFRYLRDSTVPQVGPIVQMSPVCDTLARKVHVVRPMRDVIQYPAARLRL